MYSIFANVVHRDLDIYYQDHKIGNANMWKTVRASEKWSSMTFIEVDIRYRMKPLYMLYLKTLTYIFKVTKLEMLIAGKLRANEKR